VISKSQVKTLTNTILPRIALYDVLIKYEPDTAVSVMRKYMMDVVAYGKHASTAKMEKTTTTSQLRDACGMMPVWKTAARNYAVCFVMWMM
jgi:hypothetical protein